MLSDDKLVEYLKRDGIDIARRTVAKYREALRIPSSVQRRRDKQMAARIGRRRRQLRTVTSACLRFGEAPNCR